MNIVKTDWICSQQLWLGPVLLLCDLMQEYFRWLTQVSLILVNLLNDRFESRVSRTSWLWRKWTCTTRPLAKTRGPETVTWRKSSLSWQSSKNRHKFSISVTESQFNNLLCEQVRPYLCCLCVVWFILRRWHTQTLLNITRHFWKVRIITFTRASRQVMRWNSTKFLL